MPMTREGVQSCRYTLYPPIIVMDKLVPGRCDVMADGGRYGKKIFRKVMHHDARSTMFMLMMITRMRKSYLRNKDLGSIIPIYGKPAENVRHIVLKKKTEK